MGEKVITLTGAALSSISATALRRGIDLHEAVVLAISALEFLTDQEKSGKRLAIIDDASNTVQEFTFGRLPKAEKEKDA